MNLTPQQLTRFLQQAGLTIKHTNQKRALWHCANSEPLYVNLSSDNGTSNIIIAPEWDSRRVELESIPDTVVGEGYYHASNMQAFPKRVNRGRKPILHGIAITVKTQKGLHALLDLLISSSSEAASPSASSHPLSKDGAMPDSETPIDHDSLLDWFEQRAGQILTWEQLQAAPATVTISAKGIYKPASLRYALSIRQTLDSSYGNQEPEYQQDGSWHYRYAQEQNKNGNSASLFTNQGLKHCIGDCQASCRIY